MATDWRGKKASLFEANRLRVERVKHLKTNMYSPVSEQTSEVSVCTGLLPLKSLKYKGYLQQTEQTPFGGGAADAATTRGAAFFGSTEMTEKRKLEYLLDRIIADADEIEDTYADGYFSCAMETMVAHATRAQWLLPDQGQRGG